MPCPRPPRFAALALATASLGAFAAGNPAAIDWVSIGGFSIARTETVTLPGFAGVPFMVAVQVLVPEQVASTVPRSVPLSSLKSNWTPVRGSQHVG